VNHNLHTLCCKFSEVKLPCTTVKPPIEGFLGTVYTHSDKSIAYEEGSLFLSFW